MDHAFKCKQSPKDFLEEMFADDLARAAHDELLKTESNEQELDNE